MSDATSAPAPGAPIGSRYVLDGVIGSGAMGQVWRATSRLGDSVAIKILRPDLTGDSEFVGRFLQEAQILTKVSHPSVVAVRDLVAEGTRLALVLDLVDGPDLRHELTRRGTFPAGLALEAVAKVLAGLGAIHAAGIVHRDVKPENVLLERTDSGIEPRISDFGIARIIESGPAARTTAILGTPEYIAPEVADGQVPTPRSDLYSVGIMLYELVAGVTPFAGGPALAVMRRHVEQQPGRPDGLPDELWDAITGLIAKDPALRPATAQSASELLKPLAFSLAALPALPKLAVPPVPVTQTQSTVMGTRPVRAPGAPIQPPGSTEVSPRERGQKRGLLIGLAALLVVALGGSAIALVLGNRATASAPASASPTPLVTASSETPSGLPTPTETSAIAQPSAIPSVLGLQLDSAMTTLQNLGLTVVTTEIIDDTNPDNTVVGQDPPGGSSLPTDTLATLTVSRKAVGRYVADIEPVEGGIDETGTATINGEDYVHSVYWEYGACSDPRSVQYDLGRHYRQFTATADVADRSWSSSRVRMEVLADGRVLWKADMTLGKPKQVQVDVTGVLRLELRATRLDRPDFCSAYTYPAFADAQIFGLPSEVPLPMPQPTSR